jgi:EamA domain-containing membrane protein RarD
MKSTQVVSIIAALVGVAVVAYLLGTMSQRSPTLTTTAPPTPYGDYAQLRKSRSTPGQALRGL